MNSSTKIFVTLTALLLAPLAAINAAEPSKPNIIYILADDMGYADPGFMGCEDIKTPNLKKLGETGTILKSFYVQPVCSPTRAALMTGRYAVRTGVYTVIPPNAKWGLQLEERTLAQALREAGYETAIVGKWHLGEFQEGYRPTNRGFDHQYGLWFGNVDYFTHKRGDQLDWHRNDQPCDDQGYSTHLLAKEACRVIREKSLDKPLFLYLPFNAVHGPWQVPDEYKKPYANVKGTRRTYAGMCAAMDEAVGQVLAVLDEKNIRDNTLIVFSSDNGPVWYPQDIEKFGHRASGPWKGMKGALTDAGHHMPFIASWPGKIKAGSTCGELICFTDMMATLASLLGEKLPNNAGEDSFDLSPLLRGEKPASPIRTGMVHVNYGSYTLAIRKGDWKLILPMRVYVVKDGTITPDHIIATTGKGPTEKFQIYNLRTDPGEATNLFAQEPAKAQELFVALKADLARGRSR